MSLVKVSIILAAAAYQDAEPAQPDAEPVFASAFELPPERERGRASWYGDGRLHGSITASGEELDPERFTCAHRTLPLQTTILVVNQNQPDRRVWCRVNDRGPYGATRPDGTWNIKNPGNGTGRYRGVLDISVAAARQLGTHGMGRQPVAIHYWTRNTRSTMTLAAASSTR